MDNQKQNWSPRIKYGISILLTFFLAIWGVYTYLNPKNPEIVTNSGINISDIFSKINQLGTSLEKSNFVKGYSDSEIYGKGVYIDLSGKTGENMDLLINVHGRPVSCVFDASTEIERHLLLLKKGQKIKFDGLFTGGAVFGGGWYIKNCNLLRTYSDNLFLRLFQIIKSRLQGF